MIGVRMAICENVKFINKLITMMNVVEIVMKRNIVMCSQLNTIKILRFQRENWKSKVAIEMRMVCFLLMYGKESSLQARASHNNYCISM